MNVPSLLKEHNSGRFTRIKLSYDEQTHDDVQLGNRKKQRQLSIEPTNNLQIRHSKIHIIILSLLWDFAKKILLIFNVLKVQLEIYNEE